MKSFFEWFKASTKVKRWILLILVGVVLTCYGIAKILVSEEITFFELGKTIAILGDGFNKIFPKENEWLFHKIINSGGCVISEYEENEEAESDNFPHRNRIVSGLSNGVLIIEAKQKSGTSITVDFALEQGKNIYAIPGNIDSENSSGTNELIKQGAKLVTTETDILDAFS